MVHTPRTYIPNTHTHTHPDIHACTIIIGVVWRGALQGARVEDMGNTGEIHTLYLLNETRRYYGRLRIYDTYPIFSTRVQG